MKDDYKLPSPCLAPKQAIFYEPRTRCGRGVREDHGSSRTTQGHDASNASSYSGPKFKEEQASVVTVMVTAFTTRPPRKKKTGGIALLLVGR